MKVGDYTSQQYKGHKVEESDVAGDLPDIRRFYESGATIRHKVHMTQRHPLLGC